jgi:diadenosine tetraphosphate (Ap4A) HIT family hydrolase
MHRHSTLSPVDCCRKGCFLCNEINDSDALSAYLGRYDLPGDKFVATRDHFAAIPDICPIVPGHTLIIARDHVLSMAQSPPAWQAELVSIKEEVFGRLQEHYGGVFCFEHGASAGGVATGICIEHAHLHLIPGSVRAVEHVEPYVAERPAVEPIDFASALTAAKGAYLYYEDERRTGFLAFPVKPLPEQFIRRMVAEERNLATWDWKEVALPYLL